MTEQWLSQQLSADTVDPFTALILSHQKYLMKIISGFFSDQADVEEVYQEVSSRLLQSQSAYSGDGFKFWAARITVNYCIDLVRKPKIKMEALDDERAKFEISLSHPSPEEKLISDQEKQQLQKIINQLPKDYQQVIFDHYFSENSYREIGEKLNLSERTVETRIYRARKMIKELWRKNAL
ncbi:MAG: sigma-70 family RNA polymerase sigma factor [Chloroflexi bacterium]|nr:sigma-70 family RNA polymerase sigma factor [Chloroflexota bacterium]